MHYETFENVMMALAKKKRKANLLLGNGFSMAYDGSIFSYKAQTSRDGVQNTFDASR